MLISEKIKLLIRLAGTILDNTGGLDKTLCSGIEEPALLTSWEVSVIKDAFSSTDECGFGFDEFDDGGGGFHKLPESRLVSIALLSKGNMPHFWKPIISSCLVPSIQVLQALGFGWSN